MAYKKILVLINVFEDYQYVLKMAELTALKLDASLMLFMAVADDDNEKEDKKHQAEKILDAVIQKMEIKKLGYTVKIGSLVSVLSAYMEEKKPDLVIFGAHRSNGFNSLFGSTPSKILNQLFCDVLIIHMEDKKLEGAMPYHKILIATDFENDAEALVEKAKSFAVSHGISLNALSVIDHVTTPIYASDYGVIPTVRRDLMKETRSKFSQWLKMHQIDSKPMCILGEPALEINRYADSKNIDLIIIGSHNKNVIDRLLFGSTATNLLNQAQKDILVVRLQ